MKIEVGELLKKIGNKLRIEDEESLTFPEDGLQISRPVRVDLKLLNVGGSILVSGKIEARVVLSCVRCLKDFEDDISVEIEEQFKREGEDLVDDDVTFPISEDNRIDLTEAIRQNLLTAMPIKPLCRKSCGGLGGTDKGCQKKSDPRLAQLGDLKSKLRRK